MEASEQIEWQDEYAESFQILIGADGRDLRAILPVCDFRPSRGAVGSQAASR